MKTRMLALLAVLVCANVPASQPGREEILQAMKKATSFMAEKAALRGGYVWVVSDDLSQRWGELPARP